MAKEDVADFAMTLLHSATVTHLMHLKTKSYSQHVALGAYYEGIVPLVDAFVEAYQGAYSVIEDYPDAHSAEDDDKPLDYLDDLCVYVDAKRTKLPQDTMLQNIVDEIVQLLDSTIYKIKRFTEA